MGAGMSVGMAAGAAMTGMAGQMFANPLMAQPQNTAQGQQQQAASAPSDDPVETLAKLKRMLDAGLIEQSEYDAKKAEILSRM